VILWVGCLNGDINYEVGAESYFGAVAGGIKTMNWTVVNGFNSMESGKAYKVKLTLRNLKDTSMTISSYEIKTSLGKFYLSQNIWYKETEINVVVFKPDTLDKIMKNYWYQKKL